MTEMQRRVLMNRLRRIASRRGYRIAASRRRDNQATDFGRFMVVDTKGKETPVLGASPRFSASLDDVRAFFNA